MNYFTIFKGYPNPMRKVVPVFILFMWWGLRQVSAQDDLYFDRALINYQMQNYEQVVEDLNKSLDDHPRSAYAYYYRSHAHLSIGQPQQALKDAKRAVKYYSASLSKYAFQSKGILLDESDTYIRLGQVYNEVEEYEKAKKWLEKAIALDPANAHAYNNLGICYMEMNDHRTAIENYDLALKYDSTFASAYNNRGAAIYYNQHIAEGHRRDIELAIADFNRALGYEPELPVAIRNRGIAKGLLKEYESAQADLKRALDLEPGNAENYAALGRLMFSKEDYQSAISYFLQALQRDPYHAETYIQMGNAKSRLGYHEESIEDQYRAIDVEPAVAGVSYYNIACNYSLMEQKEAMMDFLQKSCKKKYFNSRSNFEHFINDPDFENYRQDEDLIAFRQKMRKKIR